MGRKLLLLTFVVISISGTLSAVTSLDTIYNYVATSPMEIDGQATEACWAAADWHAIDEVWIPWGTAITANDFEGRFKVSWDAEYLYMLMEITDNILSDDHSNPLENWWDDDCLEIFIDENRSMGDHERNQNAFAYHISLSYDAVDLNSSGSGINYKDHVNVDMDTISENLYQWEMAIKIYDASYNHSSQEDSRVTLKSEKMMGLTVAYCDNDETSVRETFIGSVYMPQSNYNDSYKNADYFGVMKLKSDGVSAAGNDITSELRVYPNPSKGVFYVSTGEAFLGEVKVYSISGVLVYSDFIDESSLVIDFSDVAPGLYQMQVSTLDKCESSKLIIY